MDEVTFPILYSDNGVNLIYCSEKCRDQEPFKGVPGAMLVKDIPEEYVCDTCGCDLSQLAGERLAEATAIKFLDDFDRQYPEPSEAFAAAAEVIDKGSLAQLAYLASYRLTPGELRQFSEHFMGIAERAARIGAYLDSRYGGGYGDQGHEKAVKKQNRIGRAVRRAQGYHNTPDINF